MVMSKDEIVVRYKQAKEPAKQIGILADLNCCTKEEIVEVLREAGYKLKGHKKIETPEAAMQQPETPEAHALTRDFLIDSLIKADKKVTMLEDILDIFAGAIEDFRETPEKIDRIELAQATLSYMAGVMDAFKAINGPIIR